MKFSYGKTSTEHKKKSVDGYQNMSYHRKTFNGRYTSMIDNTKLQLFQDKVNRASFLAESHGQTRLDRR